MFCSAVNFYKVRINFLQYTVCVCVCVCVFKYSVLFCSEFLQSEDNCFVGCFQVKTQNRTKNENFFLGIKIMQVSCCLVCRRCLFFFNLNFLKVKLNLFIFLLLFSDCCSHNVNSFILIYCQPLQKSKKRKPKKCDKFLCFCEFFF